MGTVSINPIRSAGEVKVSAVDVKKYLPYAEDFFRGSILSGKVEARVPYRFALGSNSLTAGVTNLAVKLTDLEVKSPESAETETGVAEIGLERVEASLEDRRGRVGLFKGNGGSVLVRRQKDGAINLLGLPAVSRTNAAAAPRSGFSQPGPPAGGTTNAPVYALGGWILNVDEVQLDNYTFKVEDLTPPKPASFLLDQLALNLKGASTVSNTPVSVHLSFRLDETGAITASGTAKITPLFADLDVAATLFVDLAITNANTQLTPLTGYMEKYGGYPLNKGRVSTTLRYRIELDVPLSGRLDDPQFSLGPIVLKVIVNIIIKAATSPFKLLGSLASSEFSGAPAASRPARSASPRPTERRSAWPRRNLWRSFSPRRSK